MLEVPFLFTVKQVKRRAPLVLPCDDCETENGVITNLTVAVLQGR